MSGVAPSCVRARASVTTRLDKCASRSVALRHFFSRSRSASHFLPGAHGAPPGRSTLGSWRHRIGPLSSPSPASLRGVARFSSNAPGGDEPDERIYEYALSDLVDVILLPFRHVLFSINLCALRFAFPGAWIAKEFWRGAPQAFRVVTPELDLPTRDARPLEGLVSSDLLRKLQQDSRSQRANRKIEFKAVLDARVMGVYRVSARPDDNRHPLLLVTVLISALEEYTSGAKRLHIRRLHKWTFQRHLPAEEDEPLGDWQVASMNKRRYECDSDSD